MYIYICKFTYTYMYMYITALCGGWQVISYRYDQHWGSTRDEEGHTTGSLPEKRIDLNLSDNEVDYTNSFMLAVKNMLCSKLHCQKVSI